MRIWPRQSLAPDAPCVLVVADDEGLRSVMARVLGRAGYAVESTGDARLALDRLAHAGMEPVDVVVCDVVMPLMNGIVLGERMREMGIDTPLVYISGLAEESALRDWGIPSSTPFLAKPFEPRQLVQLVDRITGGGDVGVRSGAR